MQNRIISTADKIQRIVNGTFYDASVEITQGTIRHTLIDLLNDLKLNIMLDVVAHLDAQANSWDRVRDDFGSVVRAEADKFRHEALGRNEDHGRGSTLGEASA